MPISNKFYIETTVLNENYPQQGLHAGLAYGASNASRDVYNIIGL